MHLPASEILAAFVGIYAAFQALTLLLTYLNAAEKQLEGRSTWTAKDGTAFEEFSVSEIAASNVLKRDFEESTSEAIFAPATVRSGF